MADAFDRLARLHRSEWRDYKRRFIPTENELIGLIDNPQELESALADARERVNQAFSGSVGQYDRFLQRRGTGLSGAARDAFERRTNLRKTAALVGAANRVRQRDYERDTAAMGGGLSGIVDRGMPRRS